MKRGYKEVMEEREEHKRQWRKRRRKEEVKGGAESEARERKRLKEDVWGERM